MSQMLPWLAMPRPTKWPCAVPLGYASFTILAPLKSATRMESWARAGAAWASSAPAHPATSRRAREIEGTERFVLWDMSDLLYCCVDLDAPPPARLGLLDVLDPHAGVDGVPAAGE